MSEKPEYKGVLTRFIRDPTKLRTYGMKHVT